MAGLTSGLLGKGAGGRGRLKHSRVIQLDAGNSQSTNGEVEQKQTHQSYAPSPRQGKVGLSKLKPGRLAHIYCKSARPKINVLLEQWHHCECQI